MKFYLTYYRFLWRYKWRLLLFFLCLSIYMISISIQPYFYQLFIDAVPSLDFIRLQHLLLAFIIIRFVRLLFDNLKEFFGDDVVSAAARDARIAVFRKIQELDFAFHMSRSTGSLISAIKRGDGAFFDIFQNINIRMAQFAVGFLVLIYFFAQINWLLVVIMIGTLVVNLLLAYFLIRYNIQTRTDFNHAEDNISEIIVDNLINYETVKLFAKEEFEANRLTQHYQDWMDKFWKFVATFRIIDGSVGVAGNLACYLVLFVGLKQVISFQLTAGQYIMVLGFVNDFYGRFFELVYSFRNVAKNQADLAKYFSILDQTVKVADPVNPINLKSVAGEIEFKKLSFTYPDSKRGAIVNINLNIRSGQSVAFVGHSGVGKTTLVKLLMRFYDPNKGQILIDGININQFTKSQLRSFMGVVPQEPILFNHSIGYNIAYGAPNVTQKQITAAAKMANLHDFIVTLPKKYDTPVGERGVKLSGGQKQRLAIARMILSNPDIIIFDEATSQLDSDSEKKIQDAFWKAARNKTTLIIAHRLSTITRADKIVVMEHGRIKEIGSHRELLQRTGSLYSHFWSLQSQAAV